MLRHLFFQFFFCSVVYHRRQQMYVCRSHFVNIYDSICSVGRNEFLEKFINSDTPCFYSDIQRSDRNEPKRWQYFDFFFLHSKYNSTKLQTTNYKRNGIFHARYEFLNYYCIRFYMAVCRRHCHRSKFNQFQSGCYFYERPLLLARQNCCRFLLD